MKQSLIPLDKLKKYINKDNLRCLDIGANTGQFYRSITSLYPNASCHLIEVNPTCEKNLAGLGVPYEMIGLSNKVGTMNLITTVKKPRSKGASFYMEKNWEHLTNEEKLNIEVPVTTLDEHFKGSSWDLVKIDVQGSELDIIEGGKDFLPTIDNLLIEVSLTEYNIGAPHARDVISKLEKMNFYVADCIDKHIDSNGNCIQIDLLFQKEIEHNVEIMKEFNLQ